MNESFADSFQQLHQLLISSCSDTERAQNRHTQKKGDEEERLTNDHERGIEFLNSLIITECSAGCFEITLSYRSTVNGQCFRKTTSMWDHALDS